jgi:hypothetical protein
MGVQNESQQQQQSQWTARETRATAALMDGEDGQRMSLNENGTIGSSVCTLISFLLKNREYIYLYA